MMALFARKARLLAAYAALARERGIGDAAARLAGRINKLDWVQFGIRGRIVPWRIRTLREPSPCAPLAEDEVTVLCVLRNGMPWLSTFLAHHRELGVRRFVFLDNGSTDGTLEHLLLQEDAFVLQSGAPYRTYENTFKRHICNRFAPDGWCLFLDIDELVAYPGMEEKPVRALCRFVGEQGFDAVVTQMLDLYPAGAMVAAPDSREADLRHVHRYYETASLEKSAYPSFRGAIAPDVLRMHRGGVRARVFGTRNGLTKVSLFRNGGKLRSFHAWHHVEFARLADFTIALLHYPFNREYRDKVIEAAQSGRYGWLTSDEYEAYAAVMRDNPDLVLKGEASRLLESAGQLVDEGFLVASPAFAAWSGIASVSPA